MVWVSAILGSTRGVAATLLHTQACLVAGGLSGATGGARAREALAWRVPSPTVPSASGCFALSRALGADLGYGLLCAGGSGPSGGGGPGGGDRRAGIGIASGLTRGTLCRGLLPDGRIILGIVLGAPRGICAAAGSAGSRSVVWARGAAGPEPRGQDRRAGAAGQFAQSAAGVAPGCPRAASEHEGGAP